MTEDSPTAEPDVVELDIDEAKTQTATGPPPGEEPEAPAELEAEVTEPPTLRQFFGLPEKPADESGDDWKAFQKKLAEEAQGIKWTAAMPDLGSKICELLDIKIHNVLLTAWKKVEAVRQAMEESKQTPDKAVYLDLAEHAVDYETKPFIDVKIKRASVKKLTLHVTLNLKIKGFGLKVQNGVIRELQPGKCEGKGAIKYEKLTIAEKKSEPIKFPLTIRVPGMISIAEPEPEAPPAERVAAEPKEVKETQAREDVERIEL